MDQKTGEALTISKPIPLPALNVSVNIDRLYIRQHVHVSFSAWILCFWLCQVFCVFVSRTCVEPRTLSVSYLGKLIELRVTTVAGKSNRCPVFAWMSYHLQGLIDHSIKNHFNQTSSILWKSSHYCAVIFIWNFWLFNILHVSCFAGSNFWIFIV